MRRKTFWRLLNFAFLVTCTCANVFPFISSPDSNRTLDGFRNIPWGASMGEVRGKEKAQYLQRFEGFDITAISFKDNIAGIEARIDYTFKDDKLTEASYIINAGDFYKRDFVELLKFVVQKFGQPEYRSGKGYNEDSVWVKENEYGSFSGPSYYWEFKNSFIALISQKFKDEITIMVLFVNGSSIGEYAKKTGAELSGFPLKFIER